MFSILLFLFLPILTAATFDFMKVGLRKGYPPVFPLEKPKKDRHLVFHDLPALIDMLKTCVYVTTENAPMVTGNYDEMVGTWTALLCDPVIEGKSLDYTISKATEEDINQFEARCDTKLYQRAEYKLKMVFPSFTDLKPTMIAERTNALFLIEPNKNLCNTINEIEFRKMTDNTTVLLIKDKKHGEQTSPAIMLKTSVMQKTNCAFFNNEFRMYCN